MVTTRVQTRADVVTTSVTIPMDMREARFPDLDSTWGYQTAPESVFSITLDAHLVVRTLKTWAALLDNRFAPVRLDFYAAGEAVRLSARSDTLHLSGLLMPCKDSGITLEPPPAPEPAAPSPEPLTE